MIQIPQMKHLLFLFAIASITLPSCNGCNQPAKPTQTQTAEPAKEIAFNLPEFNSDSAFEFIKKQVGFGPRVPNTNAHEQCAAWIINQVKNNADSYFVQKFDVVAYDGKTLKSTNIIGSLNPSATRRILLVAHWDTRPVADQDNERKEEPIPGANDGGSGVGVLLEVLRAAKQIPLNNIGIDFLLVDSEDYGQPSNSKHPYMPDSYCLGSQHWGKSPHVPDYKADFGILLDMVGGKNALFTREGTSRSYAGWVLDRVWANAAKIGYSNFFSNVPTDPITDDHKYINELRKIPTIDIIQYDVATPTGFANYWHTHNDNLDAVDKTTLNAVGHTVLYTIYQYNAEMKPL